MGSAERRAAIADAAEALREQTAREARRRYNREWMRARRARDATVRWHVSGHAETCCCDACLDELRAQLAALRPEHTAEWSTGGKRG